MSRLTTLLRWRPGARPRAQDGDAPGLGLAGWDGADRWPADDARAPEPADGDVDLWIAMDPGRPSTPM